MTNPLPPTGVTISARAGHLVINWNAPNGRTDLTYEIEVSVFDNDLLPTIYPSASMSFTLNVADTARRFLRVRCVDTAQSRSTWTATISKAATPPGTFTEGVDLDMSNHTLLNLSDPVLAQEPATKAYVDAHSGGGSSGQTFPPSGDLSMGSHKITNVATPTAVNDAATKGYVDTHSSSATTSYNPDTPPVSPNAMDDEFEGSTLNSKWTWFNQTAFTYTVENSRLNFVTSGSNYGGFIAQPITDTSWAFITKTTVNFHGTIFGVGPFVYNSANGHFSQLVHYQTIGTGGIAVFNWNGYTAYQNTVGSTFSSLTTIYSKVSLSAGVLSYFVSADGIQYGLIATDTVSANIGGVTHIGVGIDNQSFGVGNVDWFRRLA